jgi:hypothetical protein
MKNTILIALAVVLLLLVIVVRYVYKQNFETFKTSVAHYESGQLEKFNKAKEKKFANIQIENPKIFQLFKSQFDERKALIQRDSTYSILYLSGSVKYSSPSFQYFDCLQNKCIVDMQNDSTQQLIIIREKELQRKFGETFTLWYPKLKDKILNKKIDKSADCNTFYTGLFQISYDQTAWNDFENFMSTYTSEIKKSQIQNSNVEQQLKTKYNNTSHQFNNNALAYFKLRLDNELSQIITKDSLPAFYSTVSLGSITYYLIRKKFNQSAYQSIEDDAFTEQWKFNSLATGAMPYSYCYGSSNYCGSYCSEIQVRTGGSDVLVTIKDYSGDVYRHAYIKSGRSFTFNVPDGQYQVFFYSGTGWNPNKYMTTTSCGTLHGGFVSAESFTKDDYISLSSQSMTYELIMQPNGNLNTQPSSMNEAFN